MAIVPGMSRPGEHQAYSVEVRELSCRRGMRTLFSGLSFTLEEGQFTEIRGPNGAGKTSLLRIMAGFLPATDGTILYNSGGSSSGFAHEVNYMGHALALKSSLTVRENVALWDSLLGQSKQDLIDRALAAFGISRLADLPLRYLSQGQKRRTALCRLLTSPRPYWLLDEPNVGLDTAATAVLADVMSQHLTNGGIILAASHIDLGITPNRTIRIQKGSAYVD